MDRQFATSCYIVYEDKILLLLHKKLKKWLPPGGHVDHNETPQEAAKREVLEETGLEIELISEEYVWIKASNAVSLERPFLCLLEEIPSYGTTPYHQHIDFAFLGRPKHSAVFVNRERVDGMKWFTKEEVLALQKEQEIFGETQEVICKIFSLKEKFFPELLKIS